MRPFGTAANPGLPYGYPDIHGLRQLAREAAQHPAEREAFLQLHLNVWLDHSSDPFVDMAVYDRGAEPFDLSDLEHAPCWLGVDLSSNSDLTVIIAAWRDGEDGYFVHPWFFCPRDNLHRKADRDGVPYPLWAEQGFIEPTPGNVVDFRTVEDTIRDLCERFEVREIAFDPHLARNMMNTLREDGYPAVEMRQGWVTMAPAVKELERAIVAGRFQHGGHPVLRWNFDNIAVETDKAGNKAFHIVAPKEGAGASKTIKGTVNDLITRYYASAGFTSKAAATQRNYKSVLEPFRKEHGDGPVAEIKTKHIDAILGEVAARSTSAAHNLRKRLFLLFKLAVKWEFRDDNPMLLADRVQHKTKGYETWSEADIAKFRARWKEGTPQRIAFEILLYTGLRRSDAVRLGPQHIQGDHINITARKTGAELSIPVHAEFRQVLKTIPHKHLVFIATERGAARSEFAFTNWIIDAAKEAGLPPHRSPHGLRKAACVRLADAGCDVFEIMAITGHSDIKEVQTYVAAANKKKAAKSGINKLYGVA